jgi:hypothetical protein
VSGSASLSGPTGVPKGLRDWIREYGALAADEGGSAEEMEAAATQALAAALARQGGSREGAFALLAADSLLTSLCEGAADASDPASRLESLVRRVSVAGGS